MARKILSITIPLALLVAVVAFATNEPVPGQTAAGRGVAAVAAPAADGAAAIAGASLRRAPVSGHAAASFEEGEEGVRTPVDPDAVTSDARPSASATARGREATDRAIERVADGPRAPGDLLLSRSADLGTGKGRRKAALVAEPSIARSGAQVLAVWNWFAARSTDGGNTFTFMNPERMFPQVYGGFCCDQLATYVPSHDLWVWVMLYEPNAKGNNAIRIVVGNGEDLASGNFSDSWLISAQSMGFKRGINIDQPDMAYSNNYLYIEVEVFKGPAYRGVSEIMRFDLDDLVDRGSLAFDYRGVPEFAPGLTFGASSTMYIAGHTDNDTLKLYAWPESLPNASLMPEWSVNHLAYPQVLPYQCKALYGSGKTNWCRRSDDRINNGWVAPGRIGFLWNASQGSGGAGLFPYPYVHVLEISETTKLPIAEPVIWSPNYAWQYGALSPNSAGDLGGVAISGGGAYYPACSTVVRDNYTFGDWGTDWYYASDAYPGRPVAGDYLSSYPNAGNSATWSAGCSFIDDAGGNGDGKGDNKDVHPVFLSFGREDDAPA